MGLEERRSLATVNAGTHEVRGDLITIHPLVAKPAMMDWRQRGLSFPNRRQDTDTEAGAECARRCCRLGADVQVRTRRTRRRAEQALGVARHQITRGQGLSTSSLSDSTSRW